MPLFGTRDQSEKCFKEAERYSHPKKKEFDLEEATRLLEEAILLKPDKKQYREKLEEIRELKAKRDLKFSMKGGDARAVSFPEGTKGVVLVGTIEQGAIRDGDEVQIERNQGRIYEVASPTGKGLGVAGQEVTLAIVTDWKMGWSGGPWRIEGVGTGTIR